MEVKSYFEHSLPIGPLDIFNHFIYYASSYDKKDLVTYKTYDDCRLFADGYVESLMTNYLKDAGIYVYIGMAKPEMKERSLKTRMRSRNNGLFSKGKVRIKDQSSTHFTSALKDEKAVANILLSDYVCLKI